MQARVLSVHTKQVVDDLHVSIVIAAPIIWLRSSFSDGPVIQPKDEDGGTALDKFARLASVAWIAE
jgi:hypothetical protein